MDSNGQAWTISTMCGENYFRNNIVGPPESLRRAFGIPTNSTVTKISSHTSASAVHLLLKEEEGQ